MNLATWLSIMDIDRIVTEQMKKPWSVFGAKMVVKWQIVPTIDQGPKALPIINIQLFAAVRKDMKSKR